MSPRERTPAKVLRQTRLLAEFCGSTFRRLWKSFRSGDARKVVRNSLAPRRGGLKGIFYRRSAALMAHLGRQEAERQALVDAARRAPDDDAIHIDLCRAHQHAGDKDAADRAMQRVVDIRARRLPPTLAEGLARLRSAPPPLISRSPLRWAWDKLAPPGAAYTDWERAVRFGQASNYLIWNWAHCARDRLDELDDLILPVDESTDRTLRGGNRGALLVGAHVGVPTAGVHFFRARKSRIRILGNEPITRLLGTEDYYIDSTIGTSLLRILRAVDRGISIGVLADSWGPTRVETTLIGEARLKVVRWVPRVIWKHHVNYHYCVTLWEGDRIRVHIDQDTCMPEDGEPYEVWEARWLRAYRDKTVAMLRTAPENLRLTGGLWQQFID